MRCDRCGYAVPDWLWIEGDHPIIIEEAHPRITRTDNIENNTMKIVAEKLVSVRMCADVNPPSADQARNEAMAKQLSVRTGLSHRAAVELVEKGWTYNERLLEPGILIHPSANLRKE